MDLMGNYFYEEDGSTLKVVGENYSDGNFLAEVIFNDENTPKELIIYPVGELVYYNKGEIDDFLFFPKL